jgi:hypothetical protein
LSTFTVSPLVKRPTLPVVSRPCSPFPRLRFIPTSSPCPSNSGWRVYPLSSGPSVTTPSCSGVDPTRASTTPRPLLGGRVTVLVSSVLPTSTPTARSTSSLLPPWSPRKRRFLLCKKLCSTYTRVPPMPGFSTSPLPVDLSSARSRMALAESWPRSTTSRPP